MLNILKKELEKYGAFDAPDHSFINAIVRAVPFNTVPTKMKLVFAISHISNFASQFRRNVELWDGTLVPTNNISFVVADSGANKDSSNSKVKKCFTDGFDLIDKELRLFVKEDAIQKAIEAGEDTPNEFAVYVKYMLPIPPTFMSITTGPGLVQHINDIGALPAGSGMVYSGEISDELAHNINTLDNIKILAEVYDLGEKEVTYTKNIEFRSKEIKGQPVSALFVGSPGHILYDETTRKKFHIAFMSKLARRSWFCYTPERVPEPDFSLEDNPTQAMLEYEYQIDQEAKAAVAALKTQVLDVTKYNLERTGQPIPVTDDVFKLFSMYKRYNREVIENSNNQESVYALVRGHLQWKALKLAGAFALMDKSEMVTAEHYVTAIQFSELFDYDISQFERDLNKAPHECLSDYLRTQVTPDNRAYISIHDIKKHGFSTSVTYSKLHEMVSLCAGYDNTGIYTIAENNTGIVYEPLIKTDKLMVSYKLLNMDRLNEAVASKNEEAIKKAKIDLAYNSTSDFVSEEITFADLAEVLKNNLAYAPFVFKDGVRGKNNIVGSTKWLVLDVDKTNISYEDAHFLLDGINHHISLTSDPDNDFKYRVIVELDSPVELSGIAWKHFYTKIAHDLGINVDVLPQSQIYYAYESRPVLSCLDGVPISARDYVMWAKEKEANKGQERLKELSNSQKVQQLEEPLETFWYAFNSDKGQRSTTLYRAVRHAQDLGASLEYSLDLIDKITEYVTVPMEEFRINQFKEQVIKLYGGQ